MQNEPFEMKKNVESLERTYELNFSSDQVVRDRSDLSWYETAGLVAMGFLGGIIAGAVIYASFNSDNSYHIYSQKY